jgi:hypothetical protein
MTYDRSTGPVTTETVAATGPNSVWDFSSLTALTDVSSAYFGMDDASFTIQFSFNDADHFTEFMLPEIEGIDLPISGASVIWNYTNTAYSTDGMGIATEFIDLPVAYIDPDETLPLPLVFGASLDDDSQLALDVPTQFFYGSIQNRTVEVDGWGSLILPGGTFDVLRVKTVITGSDSINVPAIEIGFSIPKDQTIYAWYAANEDTPVLSILEIAGIPLQATFKDGAPVTAIAEAFVEPFSIVGPVPVRNRVRLRGVQSGQSLQVMDAMGRTLRTVTVDSQLSVSLEGLAKGTYFLQVSGDASPHSSVRVLVD